jgi:Ca2+-transporting ATPase
MKRQNKFLFLAMVVSLVLTTAVIFIPPIAAAFEFEAISLTEYFAAMGLAVLVIPIVEVVKFFQRKKQHKI